MKSAFRSRILLSGAMAMAVAILAFAEEPPVSPIAQDNAAPTLPPEIASKLAEMAAAGVAGAKPEDLPKWEDVSKDYVKVVSTADGAEPMYNIYRRDKDQQLLAELPRNFDGQKLFIAYTIAKGTETAGVQTGDRYAYWKRYDKQLALIEPNIGVQTSGDFESNRGRDRVFTDRVILTVPIACMGPGGGPVIDADALLVGQATNFFGWELAGSNASLATVAKAKAYPKNIELGFELPLNGGRLGSIYYSISVIPDTAGYKPRAADLRIGYFTTTHRDLGKPGADTPWVRYINRWKLEKADPSLKMSPPKEPIVFYLENTIPVRYRRWVRDGVIEWNKAFEKVGISNAIEVYQQDAQTGAHMDKDPEDARYNFVMWTNAGMGFAIGPSRVDPRTGQILDADIVMDEGFITSWAQAWKKVIPQTAMEGLGPETLAWLETRPTWDPRVRLAPPAMREDVIKQLAFARAQRSMDVAATFAGHPGANADPTLIGNDLYDGLIGQVSQKNGACMEAMAKSLDVALFRLGPEIFAEIAAAQDKDPKDPKDPKADGDKPKDEPDVLDGIPEWFIGPLLKDVVMHECGHTLGLRHNFKASSVYSMKEINTAEFKGRAQTASVMDYNPININFGDGPVQGDYTMATIGPYDYWAISYGYTIGNDDKDLKPILAKVSEDDLPYATDEDTWGPDPYSRRFDFAANPLDYADSQMRLVIDLRGKIVDRMVKDGQSWSKAREGYEILLGRHFGAVAIATNFIGGANVNRDQKGDPGNRNPVTPINVDQQRRALKFVIDNMFNDSAFGLNTELLSKMTVDKWYDEGGMGDIFEDPTWPVHDRIMGLQAAALTMILNPTRLNRVYDNEFRVSADADAVTLPEVIFGVTDAVWIELDKAPSGTYSNRKPMISSLRRNLQREELDRLIDLTMPNAGFGAASKPVANLCVFQLRNLSGKIDKTLKSGSTIDAYSLAHLSEAKVRIDKALDAQYIYNINEMGGGGMPFMMFGQPQSGVKESK